MHSPLCSPPRVLCRASRRPAQSRRVSFSVDAGARSRRVARGGMGTNGAKRSVTVLRAGRGRRTPETTRVCVCMYTHTYVSVARRARRCSRCTPTSLCSPVTFAEAACLLPLFLSLSLLLLRVLSSSSYPRLHPGVKKLRSVDRPILT